MSRVKKFVDQRFVSNVEYLALGGGLWEVYDVETGDVVLTHYDVKETSREVYIINRILNERLRYVE